MNTNVYRKAFFVLTLAGVLFSGYLSSLKFFSNVCAFNETCPYFLGYPACYFGFAMFLILFITSSMLLVHKMKFMKAARINLAVSALGILFSGYFAYPEIRDIATGAVEGSFLGLTTCIYGLIFYILVLLVSASALRRG